VMEFIPGDSIDTFCDTNRLSIQARLKLFMKVCSAVEYAHQNLVVHRDLKPRNILVTADSEPKLLDFGIAKLLADERDETAVYMRVMTPDYASPEQIRGEPITTASDVYSLGVVLYHLLTGGSPYRSADSAVSVVAREICEQSPALPSATHARVHCGTSERHWRTQLRGDLDS